MNCKNCNKLILEPGVTYGINPNAVCRCDTTPLSYQLPKTIEVPICLNCGKPMEAVFDKIAKKYTGHLWSCECMPKVILSIG